MKNQLIHTEDQELAYLLAKRAHGTQLYGTQPYVDYHIIGVVKILKDIGYMHNYTTVALLHDILEDTEVTEQTLSSLFDSDIVEAVKLLTKTKNISRQDYLNNIKTNPLALFVKIADSTFNMNENLRNKNMKRASLYAENLHILTS